MRVLNRRKVGVPTGSVYVGRPTKWGNPFPVEAHGREECLRLYAEWLAHPERAALREQARTELAGRDLVCWCAPLACHAELLMAVAND